MSPLARICARCRRPVPVDQLRKDAAVIATAATHAPATSAEATGYGSHTDGARWASRYSPATDTRADGAADQGTRCITSRASSTRSTQPRGIPPGASPSGAHATAASTRPKRAGAHDQGSVVTVRYTHFPRYDELIC
jgi:hypothetical protein